MVSGHAEGYMNLNSFDQAILNAGVGNCNLVRMSSIIPPNCKEIKPIKLPMGALVPLAYSSIISNTPGEIITASMSVALPVNTDFPGLIMEYSSVGRQEQVEEIVKQMAVEGMKFRRRKVKEIKSIAIEHEVANVGCAFCGVVLWE